uniref:AzlD domain-containing protein n=1 Tax=Romanomermis culicivorax TaxID=13658 RepID=A0A915KIU8_ROMCU
MPEIPFLMAVVVAAAALRFLPTVVTNGDPLG